MKRNLKLVKKSPKAQPNPKKTFTTFDEVGSYFFPEGRPEKGGARGKERGAKAAENAFTEIARSL
jgi:hypothetical protein